MGLIFSTHGREAIPEAALFGSTLARTSRIRSDDRQVIAKKQKKLNVQVTSRVVVLWNFLRSSDPPESRLLALRLLALGLVVLVCVVIDGPRQWPENDHEVIRQSP